MHNRQSGAAHVPIMFFLILLVIFLGTLGFAYVTQTKNGDLIKQRDSAVREAGQLREQSVMVNDYIKDLGAVLAKPGKYAGHPGGIYGPDVQMTMEGVTNPEDIKKTLEKACTDAGISPASGIENTFGAVITALNQSKRRITEIEAERDKVMADRNEIDTKFRGVSKELTDKSTEWSRSLDQVSSDFAVAKQDKANQITQVQDNLKAKAEELQNAKDAATKREKELNNDLAKERMHVSAVLARDAMRNPEDQADGKILIAKTGITTAFINLGRKDLLQPGTVFRVKNPNSKDIKGYATVTRVEEERSEVALSDFADPVGDYAREGDLLYNKLFSPRMTRTIYLMGRFSAPYHKPELTKLLTRLGNKVVDKMAPGVDTVILGNDPVNEAADGFTSVQDSEEFKKATELRVEFAYLTTIADLIKL